MMKRSIMSQAERKPHKHAAIIKAWADGATIQWRRDWGMWPTEWADWQQGVGPTFDSAVIFRIKPVPTGTVLMRCYGQATDEKIRAHPQGNDFDIWQRAAELFLQAVKNSEVKE